MAWLDDRVWCHPKLVNLSDRSWRVFINSIAYSSGMGTKGTLTAQQQKLLGGTPKVRRELISLTLWHELDDGGVRIHDWAEHNEKRDAKRISDRERKRRQRDKERDIARDNPRDRRTLTNDRVNEVAKATSGQRAPNELWDALAEVFGEPSTPHAATLRGRVCRTLKQAGATPDEIHRRARSWPRHFDDATLTETALEKHWDRLGRAPLRAGAR